MFVKVKLLKGFAKPLFYKIPDIWQNQKFIGTILQVPFKNTIVPAIVVEELEKLNPEMPFKIREASKLERLPNDHLYLEYSENISNLFFLPPNYFFKRIKYFLKEKNDSQKNKIFIPSIEKPNTTSAITLTEEQSKTVEFLEQFIAKPKYSPTLLHGVTGSGKTEIYAKLILKNLNANKSVIFLIPEISLAIQFQNIFKTKLPNNTHIFGFHSATAAKEKQELWNHLIETTPILIIGIQLPILLPISNLGLIIIDEEHDTNYQETKSPQLNSKTLAIYRAYKYQIPILLGSATPSISSLYNVKEKGWNFFQIKKRFCGALPQIQKIKLNSKRRRSSFWITRELENEIRLRLQKKEQTMIFLNRRGHSFFVICQNCGFVFECPNCSVSLTLHLLKSDAQPILQCHYCNFKKNLPTSCPKCKTSDKNFLKKGVGTEQIVSILEKIFPTAKIARADLDTTLKKNLWQDTLKKFEAGDLDILVGTKIITKGYHFPKVTLVGILWADIGLHFPIFNATETTLQQLIQVAGRAGRQSQNSKVIVQIMQESEIFNYLNEENYLNFYKQEIEFRKITNYPPFCYLIHIEIKHVDAEKIESESYKLFEKLNEIKQNSNLQIQILGPAKPAIYKIQKTELRQIFLKAKIYKTIQELLNQINFQEFESQISIIQRS